MFALLGLRPRYKPRQSEHFIFGAIPALQEHVLSVAYIILCLRFTLLVRLVEKKSFFSGKYSRSPISAQRARLDTGGWLDLTRQGLSPCKVLQASLVALTPV